MNCIKCQKKVGETYRINGHGDLFCSDNCYEILHELSDDNNHPYIDDYEGIRQVYIDWYLHWEEDLQETSPGGDPLIAADTVMDKIDEVYEDYSDFYRAEGDDGVFAHEIYLYLLKFEQLQKKILQWRPQREIYYSLSIDDLVDTHGKPISEWLHFVNYLYNLKAVNVFFLLKDHVHPYDLMTFCYEDESYALEVIQELENALGKEYVSENVFLEHAYLCEGGCGDYELVDNEVDMKALNGWFYCCTCEDRYYPGYFSKEELLKELDLSDHQDDVHIKHSKTYNWYFYIRKIKRSCRFYEFEFPEWIDFDYE